MHSPLAHRALSVDREIGLLLRSNVVVPADAAATLVQALEPQTMVSVNGRPSSWKVVRGTAADGHNRVLPQGRPPARRPGSPAHKQAAAILRPVTGHLATGQIPPG
jgi:hypothetical protein